MERSVGISRSLHVGAHERAAGGPKLLMTGLNHAQGRSVVRWGACERALPSRLFALRGSARADCVARGAIVGVGPALLPQRFKRAQGRRDRAWRGQPMKRRGPGRLKRHRDINSTKRDLSRLVPNRAGLVASLRRPGALSERGQSSLSESPSSARGQRPIQGRCRRNGSR